MPFGVSSLLVSVLAIISLTSEQESSGSSWYNSAAYKGLLSKVPDLDQTILSQVQFCINDKSACNNAGEYFVADFVAVMEKVDGADKKYLDVVIIDSKLSAGTDFTLNQKKANDRGIMAIKSVITDLNLVKGNVPINFAKGVSISKNGSNKKMWSDGNGNYLQVE